MGSVLSRNDILNRRVKGNPLIRNLIDEEVQIGENGVDLTVKAISKFISHGAVDFSNEQRVISETRELEFDDSGWLTLEPGCYRVEYNEIVDLPKDVVGIVMPRSSLIRCGVALITSIWDAGYCGRGKSTLVVFNSEGFSLKEDARIAQMVFLLMANPAEEGYRGVFQREDLRS